MSLTDTDIENLAKKMSIPLAGVFFKDELPPKLEFNKFYIINLENSEDEEGNENDGTHWTAAQCNKYPNGTKECIFFDPYGQPPSENVKKTIKNTTGQSNVPHTTRDIQSLMNNACGWYCLALGHYINASQYRTKNLHDDVNDFVDLFDDLNVSVDFKKNEFILKHFFRSSDPNLRRSIEVIKPLSDISDQDEKGTKDAFRGVKIPVDINVINK
jgi:hypothetical protein